MAIQYNTSLDRTFHALGDGTRRKILSILAGQGASTASELLAPFDVAQPTISKHLKVLEKAGLVRREVEGRIHRFELVTNPMDEAESWISRHKQFWEGTLSRLDTFVDQLEKPSNKQEKNE
ncbi:ArsR/SmtB family transcription factor [Agaribacter marinus]|uniref:Transcriptional regulator n=1 Tax=Agaribacter marinus TaxID=1431249 RepID=A0AA37STU7_9ALTE|nr:metalloregulator ArsR/SmtB family transcription factor [Agaribacter marinus]GLR69771.1 transcriptional regulator [Agaribacter marinus]